MLANHKALSQERAGKFTYVCFSCCFEQVVRQHACILFNISKKHPTRKSEANRQGAGLHPKKQVLESLWPVEVPSYPLLRNIAWTFITYIQGGWIDLHECAPSKHNRLLWQHDCTHVEKHLSTINYVSMIYFCISLLRSQRRTLDVVFDVKANEDLTLRSLQHESNVRASCTLTANRLLQQQCKKLWGNGGMWYDKWMRRISQQARNDFTRVNAKNMTCGHWTKPCQSVARPLLRQQSPQPSTREYIAFNVEFNSVWQHGCPNRKYALKQCSKKDGNSKIH